MINFVAFLVATYLITVSGNKRLVLNEEQDLLTRFAAIENRLDHLEKENIFLKNAQVRSTYIRWGKTICPGNGTNLVYKGYVSGSHWNQPGGGVNSLCLPDDPTWNKFSLNEQWVAYVYGAEADSTDSSPLFGYNYNGQDMPCAVCQTDRSTNVMIPGRANCYPGWTQEYTGYILAGRSDHPGSTDFICLDENPEAVPGGGTDDNERVMYFIETTCSTLPCPPYYKGRELSCVVCSH